MVVSSTLVNVTEDAELRIVGLMADAAPSNLLGNSFRDTCSASIHNGDASGLLQAVVGDTGAVASLMILQLDEATAAMSILAALLNRVAEKNQQSQLATALASAIRQSGAEADNATLKRKMLLLSILFNMRDEPVEKVALLDILMQLAGSNVTEFLSPESTLGSLLAEPTRSGGALASGSNGTSSDRGSAATLVAVDATSLSRLAVMLDAWKTPLPARQGLYRTVVSVLPDTDVRKQRFLLLLTESYSSADKNSIEAAREAAIGAIRDPVTLFVQQRNLLKQPAIQALESQDAKLYGLLQVFQEGKLSDYNQFVQKNGGNEAALLSPYGLHPENCRRNMQILSLCSLASEHEEIPYSVVAETLQLTNSDSQVETWVIAAVGSGLLQAKMDQLSKMVMVERSVVRRFDAQQWKILQARLHNWKKNVGGILQVLKEHQTSTGTAATTTV
ncbi:translation initiation factor 3 subunit M [Fistulifera solaris]|uniref:Eukaryotic translation initiation factor 3 subunit M n=1 Tax=Fistulifera solaris TaxID=1519565 RepID=A0A1Z5JJX7_FISSO|nr:translation initiation factor 3 subunit M [Fistulifera solaris]|eukprot:GAX14299.1 translation initiation factor 3 subunit M [Fistulifera solaris]